MTENYSPYKDANGIRHAPPGAVKAQNHTPTPWQILPEECDKPYIRIRGTKVGGRYKVANVLTPIYDGTPEWEAKQTRANAEFIVRACNEYYFDKHVIEYLIATLEKAHARLKNAKDWYGTAQFDEPLDIEIGTILTKAKAGAA